MIYRIAGVACTRFLQTQCSLCTWPLSFLFSVEGCWLLKLAGSSAYEGDFIARHLWPIIYPAGLTQSTQNILGGIVITLNCIIYAAVVVRMKRINSRDLM